MNVQSLTQLLEQSTFYVTASTNDLEEGDDLVEVPNGGNSLNWILGHLAHWRDEMIEVAGGTRVWRDGVGLQYRGNLARTGPRTST